jgi:hypothetical protein
MRTALTLALGLMFAASGAFADDSKPINTVCPKSGKPADGTHVAHVKGADGKAVTVATCCDKCKAKVEAEPAVYVPAAKENKQVK